MSYTIFEKEDIRSTEPTVTFSDTGRISLNAATTRIFHNSAVEYVLIMLDRDNHKVALRPIGKKDSRAYKVTYQTNTKGANFSGKSFLDFAKIDYSKKLRCPAEWNEDERLLEILVPPEAFKDDKQRRLVPVEQGKRQAKMA